MSSSTEDLLQFHAFLASDINRISRFQRALQATVKPGEVVLDLGAGTGLFGLFACDLGARRVYAVESERIIDLARLLASTHPAKDRIQFLSGFSTRVDLPELVDVIVTDLCGSFGINCGILGLMSDARKRFLKSGGRVIPRSLKLFLAPVENPETYAQIEVWSKTILGVDLSAARPFAVNNTYHVSLPQKALLGEPAPWIQRSLEESSESDLRGSAHFVTTRSGTFHGLGGWFEAELGPGITVSNSPLSPTNRYRQFFFPIGSPIAVGPGEPVDVDLQCTTDGESWRWNIQVGGKTFEHSTFLGFPISPSEFSRTASTHVPVLGRRGEALLFVLQSFRSHRSIAEIESDVLRQFGDCFPNSAQSADFVRQAVLAWA
jgi:protein arginine N-methyltransferase 1